MKSITLEKIMGRNLPAAWARRAGVAPDELVDITIRRAASEKQPAPFDRRAVQKIIDRVVVMPVLDDRTPEEILGYDEQGLPK